MRGVVKASRVRGSPPFAKNAKDGPPAGRNLLLASSAKHDAHFSCSIREVSFDLIFDFRKAGPPVPGKEPRRRLSELYPHRHGDYLE
jgi:hypothetical protein